jgi:deoxyribodipyrimidine photo-lyase
MAPVEFICPNNRAGALRQLEEFLPRVPDYARERNHVRAGHPAVSRLSPAIRHRLISEGEVVARVLEAHPFVVAEKFLQEVCWRSYWKGWLEMRPMVWDDYLRQLRDLQDSPEGERARRVLDQGSGNRIIDHFLRELRETGYLHNHARMWFAGWWIHQAGLPWQLGAAHFMDHLLDADAASNTLSWRWVAGRQTPGKHYLTRASNLVRYLDLAGIAGGEEALGLFHPDEPVSAADSATPPANPASIGGTGVESVGSSDPVLVWIHSEDLSMETWLPESLPVAGIVTGNAIPVTGARGRWLMKAELDAAERATKRWNCHVENVGAADPAETLIATALALGTRDIVSAFVPTGPSRDECPRIHSKLAEAGITWHEVHRAWDLDIWPLARAGFFPFWKKLSGKLRK